MAGHLSFAQSFNEDSIHSNPFSHVRVLFSLRDLCAFVVNSSRRQAIIWINTRLLSIGASGTQVVKFWSKYKIFIHEIIVCEMTAISSRGMSNVNRKRL